MRVAWTFYTIELVNDDGSPLTEFSLRILRRVDEIEPAAWDVLSGGRPFQSHRWYAYGERVMADCPAFYALVMKNGAAIARATFFLIRNEPLPLPAPLRWPFQALFRYRPLLICRSPLSSTGGLVLPEPPLREGALRILVDAARQLAKEHRASFVMFDFLEEAQIRWEGWPADFLPVAVPQPGTKMEIRWPTFEAYLAQLSPKARKHYRQYQRAAERMNLRLTFHERVTDLDAALRLMRAVERRHHAAPNPWARRMLEEAWRVEGRWLAAYVQGRLAGCELILSDSDAQMVTALGLDGKTPNVYFLLGYADIRYAIERGARLLRWGSGAYEVKRRLGFTLETNNHAMIMGQGGFAMLARWFGGRPC